jgi:hypothetical protein
MSGCLKQRNANQTFAVSLYFAAFLGSSAATIIVAAAGSTSRGAAAVLAAIPAVVTLALTAFRPDARAQWWWTKYAKLDDLVLEMEREGKTEAVASKELREFLRVHESKYPGLGRVPSGAAA